MQLPLLEDWQVNKNAKALVEYHNIRSELKKYHDVEIPEAISDRSDFVGIASAIIGAVVTGVGMYNKSKAKQQSDADQLAYNNAVQTQTANTNLQSLYGLEAKNDQDKQASITLKYTIGIIIVLGVLLGLFFYLKRK